MKIIESLIQKTLQELFQKEIPATSFSIDLTPEAHLGDWAVNCFALAKTLGKRPDEITSLLAEALCKNPEITQAVALGGYMNITASPSFFQKAATQFCIEPTAFHGKKIVVDYIGPNAGKPLHIGHLCTPSHGQVIINTLKHLGYSVTSDAHIGDWGGIYGRIIFGWEKSVATIGKEENEKLLAEKGVYHLVKLYQDTSALIEKEEAEGLEETEKQCRAIFRKLTDGNEEYVKLWFSFTQASSKSSLAQAARLLAVPDVNIGESFYEGLNLPKTGDYTALLPEESMTAITQELITKNIATKNDDGSVGITFSKESKIPSVMLEKRDGTHGYTASDIACIKYRLRVFQPEKIIYCTDVRQQMHFKQVFATAKTAWSEAQNVEFVHAFNGFIKLKEGAMSTRKGNVIFLDDVIDEAHTRVKAVLAEKNRNISEEDIEKIGVAALKWSVLSQDRERDIVFDWDKILALEGNSGPYVQYAYVRAQKLLREIGAIPPALPCQEVTQYEKDLVRLAFRFDTVIQRVAAQNKAHHLAQYAFELASAFNSFYANTDSIKDEQDMAKKTFRTHLVRMTSLALEKAFNILALPLPEEM